MDNDPAEVFRASMRTGLAQLLTASARALATASQVMVSVANQLHPPEPSGPSEPRPESPRSARPDAGVSGHTASRPVPSRDSTATASGRPMNELAERSARDVISEIGDLTDAELRRLRQVEARGKARKTVLAAIDQALQP